ncbi:MAG: succinate dehydrogenase cytochrome b subunit [Candidatus Omnitrophota bacterium]
MCIEFLKSSIGKKAVMAVTGLLLLGFVVAHMLGNLQIFLGQEALNAYAHKLQSLPLLLWTARAFLLLIFAVHVVFSLILAVENKRARPVPYAYKDTVEASLASRTMVLSGLLILLFVIYHLLHFTLGVVHPEYFHLLDSKGRHDVYSMSLLSYRLWPVSAAYFAAMIVLYMHLKHGAPRFFQSLGIVDEKTRQGVECAGKALAWIILVGNSSILFAAYFGFLKLPPGAA